MRWQCEALFDRHSRFFKFFFSVFVLLFFWLTLLLADFPPPVQYTLFVVFPGQLFTFYRFYLFFFGLVASPLFILLPLITLHTDQFGQCGAGDMLGTRGLVQLSGLPSVLFFIKYIVVVVANRFFWKHYSLASVACNKSCFTTVVLCPCTVQKS